MEEPFYLTVTHKGKEKDYPAQLVMTGYTHKLVVQVGDVEVWYERDEDGAYRAILPPTTTEKQAAGLDKELVQLIASKIEQVLA